MMGSTSGGFDNMCPGFTGQVVQLGFSTLTTGIGKCLWQAL